MAVRIEGTTDSNGEIIEEGTGILVKKRVQTYFDQLRSTLNIQEGAAINAVETYVRERLCSIRQLQEDLVAWLSQVNNHSYTSAQNFENFAHFKIAILSGRSSMRPVRLHHPARRRSSIIRSL